MANYNIKTTPNQKVIKVKKEVCDKQHLYAAINLDAMDAAAVNLDAGAFKLWIYFAKNQNNYEFALSSKDANDNFGLKKRQYDNAVAELIEKKYLVETSKNHFTFNEIAVVSKDNNEEEMKNSVVSKSDNAVVSKRNNVVVSKDNNELYQKDTRNTTTTTLHTTLDNTVEGFAAKKAANPSVKPVEEEKPKAPRLGSRENPYPMSRRWLENHCNDLRSCGEGIWMYGDNDYVVEKPVEEETFKF